MEYRHDNPINCMLCMNHTSTDFYSTHTPDASLLPRPSIIINHPHRRHPHPDTPNQNPHLRNFLFTLQQRPRTYTPSLHSLPHLRRPQRTIQHICLPVLSLPMGGSMLSRNFPPLSSARPYLAPPKTLTPVEWNGLMGTMGF